MTTIIDVTLPLSDHTPLFPGDPPFSLRSATTIQSHGYSTQLLGLGSHAGTHVDAPSHFLAGGMSVDEIPLEVLCGDALVLDLAKGDEADLSDGDGGISASLLARFDLTNVRRLLLKTKGATGKEPWTPVSGHLLPDAALYLRDATSVRLVGIDGLSIENDTDGLFPVHHTLLTLEPPIIVVEGLDLRNVPGGCYQMYCLPLPLRGGDAAPARVVLQIP
jgi:arylformamidase